MRGRLWWVAITLLAGCHRVFGVDPPLDDAAGPIDGEVDAALPLGAWKAVSTGENFTCGLRDDGALYCWGRNDSGRLGVNIDDAQIQRPRRVDVDATWKAVSAGEFHACAIKSDDTLWCWGDNSHGQVGANVGNSVDSPQQVGGTWSAVTTGDGHTCGIRSDGELLCWGLNEDGQLGTGNLSDAAAPTPVAGVQGPWALVTAGSSHTCAVDSANLRWCWGANESGQLGDGAYSARTMPTQIGNEGWSFLDAGGDNTCGIVEGRVRCWGDNFAGQIGDGTSGNDRPEPTALDGGYADWVELSVADSHACGRRMDGSTWCWGDTSATPLPQNVTSPTLLDASMGWIAVSTNQSQTCRIGADHNLWCSGDQASGQLGNDAADATRPQMLEGTWSQLDAGARFTCGISPGGVQCWGENHYGSVGNGTRLRALLPTEVAGNVGDELTVGRNHACTRNSADNAVDCWGVNHNGSLGTGVAQSSTPVRLATPFSKLTAGDHTCSIGQNSGLWCWGTNRYGALGLGDNLTRAMPVRIGTANWKQVSAHEEHTCAIDANNVTRCWGLNDRGQVGDNTTMNRLAPVAVTGAFVEVYTGGAHSCARNVAMGALCWGRNANGQLGTGTNTDAHVPTAVTGGLLFTQLSLGNHHTCGISAGKLYCWGQNYNGQLGLGDFSERRMPTQVGTDDNWASVTAGDRHTCAVRDNGTGYCWGASFDGQLGVGAVWSKPFVPVMDPS